MNETLLRSWWMPALRGAVAVAFGLLALLGPSPDLVWLIGLFAAYGLLGGAVWTVGALRNRFADPRWRMQLLIGLLGIGAGLLALMRPVPTAMVLVLLIGTHALATGLLELAAARRLRKHIRGERLFALSACMSIVFGLAVSVDPVSGAVALAELVGVYTLASGVALLALSLRVRAWWQLNGRARPPAPAWEAC